METVSMREFDVPMKEALLKELGYASDGEFVTTQSGEKVKDRYTLEDVRVSNMLILQGSTIILDDNPLSVLSYFEEFGETF